MKKSEAYPKVIYALKKSLTSAQSYYLDNNLASRRRKPVGLNYKGKEDPFEEYVRLQMIEKGFVLDWHDELESIMSTIKKTDKNDYQQALMLFDKSLHKDQEEPETVPAKFEQQISNLQEIIDWLSEKYLIGRTGPFSYDFRKNHLKRGNEIIVDYSVGKRKDSNSYVLLRKLFRKTGGNYGQYCCSFDEDSGSRPMYHAMKLINSSTSHNLVVRKRYKHNKTVIYKLNKDLL